MTQARPVQDVLIELGLVTQEQWTDAAQSSAAAGAPPLQILVTREIVSKRDAYRATTIAAGLEYVDVLELNPDMEAVELLNSEQARKFHVMPLHLDGDQTVVIAADAKTVTNWQVRDDLTTITGRKIKFVVAMRSEIEQKINVTYRAERELGALAAAMVEQEDATDLDAAPVGLDAPLIKYVNLVLTQAIIDGASDIHIEPSENTVRVRYRIDGVLKESPQAPKEIQNQIISRVKIMASMDIAEKRRPQDGRLSVMHQGRKMDLRVASLPTVWGEKIVMRILDNSTASMSLDALGFASWNYDRWKDSFSKPYGMILVTGPTGSGKSTTLYATLNVINKPEVNIITVEDPVEYRIPGINQVQVHTAAGMTFAAALRSILRADPDIVLIGEIRDHETAQIAVEAALTGHLVLSTLHTNDAPSAIVRLTEMGIEPFLVGSAVDCVQAQRLARRLCPKCKERYDPSAEELAGIQFEWPEQADREPTFYRPVGCNHCAKTGFKGRLGMHEVMTMSEEIEKLAIQHASSEEIGRTAITQGMRTLRQDGWYKVGRGDTTIEEVLRVIA